jgi:FtsZ-interacting cell division protein ZipA
MDAGTFRWVLIAIAGVLALAIYLFGQHQARLRKRNAIETFTREEIDSAFIEDEQLRFEMNNLSTILEDNEVEANLGEVQIDPILGAQEPQLEEDIQSEIQINPAMEVEKRPSALPDPEIFVPPELADKNEDRLISYHLRHSDFRLIIGEEVESAAQHLGLELSDKGLLEYYEEGELAFQIASLSAPGNFFEIEELNFATLGFNCFIDLDSCTNPRLAYESILKKIDELVRILDVKVYKSSNELLTISDVTDIREKLA